MLNKPILRSLLMILVLVELAACTASQPKNINNICEIFPLTNKNDFNKNDVQSI